ncbi:hypothetical protein [Aquimarina algiphila]|uniref:hypothetical protein n=1 Tax=Aquimarina algiphila TaxID=2047982 RepID=UPI00232F57A0|nr:hypothetical protein [Aquimarina algiphila]
MKKIFFVLAFICTYLLTSCTTPRIEEEIYYTEENELISVDREEIQRPGDQG